VADENLNIESVYAKGNCVSGERSCRIDYYDPYAAQESE